MDLRGEEVKSVQEARRMGNGPRRDEGRGRSFEQRGKVMLDIGWEQGLPQRLTLSRLGGSTTSGRVRRTLWFRQ